MDKLKIELVTDVRTSYPYLEIFSQEELIIKVSISDSKELEFNFFPCDKQFVLTQKEWETILKESKDFLVEAVANDEEFKKWGME